MSKKYTIGVEIEEGNIRAILFDGEKIIDNFSLANPRDNLEHFIIILNAVIEPLIKKSQEKNIIIEKIGISLNGAIGENQQKILSSDLVFLEKVILSDHLKDKIKIPIFLDNHINCFLRSEIKIRKLNKYNNIYSLIINNSISASWWLKNNNYNIESNPHKMIIECGEFITIGDIYNKLSKNNISQTIEQFYQKDQLAEQTLKEISKYISINIINIIHTIKPEIIIMGGEIIEISELFFSIIKKNIRKYITDPELKKIKILKSKIKNDAIVIGAALI